MLRTILLAAMVASATAFAPGAFLPKTVSRTGSYPFRRCGSAVAVCVALRTLQ